MEVKNKIENKIEDKNVTGVFDNFRNKEDYKDIISNFIAETIPEDYSGWLTNAILLHLYTDKSKENKKIKVPIYTPDSTIISSGMNELVDRIILNTKVIIIDSDKEYIYKKVYIDIVMFPFYHGLQLDEKRMDLFDKALISPFSKAIIKKLFGDYTRIVSIDELKKIKQIIGDIQNKLKSEQINKERVIRPINPSIVKNFNIWKGQIRKKTLKNILEELNIQILEINNKNQKGNKGNKGNNGDPTLSPSSPIKNQSLQPPTEEQIRQKEEQIRQEKINEVLNSIINIAETTYNYINENNYDYFLRILNTTRDLLHKYKDNIDKDKIVELSEALTKYRKSLLEQRHSLQKSHNQQNAINRINAIDKNNEKKRYRQRQWDNQKKINGIDNLSGLINYILNSLK